MKLRVTFDSGHPAELEGLDGAVALVYEDQRPLKGVATRADWRLNGFLSRLVQQERFTGESDEWLLIHTQGRLPYTHLFLVGMGCREVLVPSGARNTLQRIAKRVALAGVHAFAIDLREIIVGDLTAEDAMVTFLEALSHAYPDDALSDPPYRPAREINERNDERLAATRQRRRELQEARKKWEAEQAAEAAAAVVGGEDAAPSEEDSMGLDSLSDAEADAVRPVAGGLPSDREGEDIQGPDEAGEASAGQESPENEGPPNPDSIEEPELETPPERVVRVVFLGDKETLGQMRAALRRLSGGERPPVDVQVSR